MIHISQNQLDMFRRSSNKEWTDRHVQTMSVLLPDVAAMYSEPDFRNMIVRILLRADQRGILLENASVAFCYASLTFGIGFEDGDTFSWVPDALTTELGKQADAIWDGIETELGEPQKEGANT